METVDMIHPALPGRIVAIPDSAVQQMIMSGWKRADVNESRQVIADLEARLELERKAMPSEPSTVETTTDSPKRTSASKPKDDK